MKTVCALCTVLSPFLMTDSGQCLMRTVNASERVEHCWRNNNYSSSISTISWAVLDGNRFFGVSTSSHIINLPQLIHCTHKYWVKSSLNFWWWNRVILNEAGSFYWCICSMWVYVSAVQCALVEDNATTRCAVPLLFLGDLDLIS